MAEPMYQRWLLHLPCLSGSPKDAHACTSRSLDTLHTVLKFSVLHNLIPGMSSRIAYLGHPIRIGVNTLDL